MRFWTARQGWLRISQQSVIQLISNILILSSEKSITISLQKQSKSYHLINVNPFLQIDTIFHPGLIKIVKVEPTKYFVFSPWQARKEFPFYFRLQQVNIEGSCMRKQSSVLELPRIHKIQKMQTLQSSREHSSLQYLLQEVKLQQLNIYKQQTSRQQQTRSKAINKKQASFKNQIKKLIHKDRLSASSQIQQMPKIQPILHINKIITDWKPPHRYKTTIGLHEGNLLLYGGLGCQKNISWAKYSFKNNQWTVPNNDNNLIVSIYGHTMKMYKGSAYIFGGTRLDSSTNQLLSISMKTMGVSHLPPAPFRRKQHAMTVISKYLVVQGGLESTNLIKNTIFYFDLEHNRWIVPLQSQMPCLSHHAMASIPYKSRKRVSALQDTLLESIYIFGGLDQNSQQSSKLFCLKVREGGQVSTQQIKSVFGPQARHSHCMQFLQPNFICIYGGRNNDQLSSYNKKNGVYNDLYLFNTDAKEWVIPVINYMLEYRFGASSCVSKNKMIIFGGSSIREYADGGIIEFCFKNTLNQEKEEEYDVNIKTKYKIL